MMQLVLPTEDRLPSYVAALRRGWSPNNERGLAASEEELGLIEADPSSFIKSLDDRDAKGPPIAMPDGSSVPRLPGFRRWMWDEEFAGSIGFRWQHGTSKLPSYCLGHIGYSVVPWKQRRGYATAALLSVLDEARLMGMPYVELTADPDNVPSQKVVLAAGGILYGKFMKPPQFGSKPGLRFRIALRWSCLTLQFRAYARKRARLIDTLGETGTVRRMTTQQIAGGSVHKLPADLRIAIETNAAAKGVWTDITPLARNEWICWVTSAKKEETRKRRIKVGIDKLRGGMRRPCCWPGCPHR